MCLTTQGRCSVIDYAVEICLHTDSNAYIYGKANHGGEVLNNNIIPCMTTSDSDACEGRGSIVTCLPTITLTIKADYCIHCCSIKFPSSWYLGLGKLYQHNFGHNMIHAA